MSLRVQPAPEREADDQEPVQRDEADDEGRHLVGHYGQESRRFAEGAVRPLLLLPQVLTSVPGVSSADHRHVDAHQKVGHAQVGDQHAVTGRAGGPLHEDAIAENTQVAAHGNQGRRPQEHPERIRLEQVIAGREFTGRGHAVRLGLSVRVEVQTAELILVSCQLLEPREPPESIGVEIQPYTIAGDVQFSH